MPFSYFETYVFFVFFNIYLLSLTYYLLTWGRKWKPTPVFLPGEFHGQRSLVGYDPWGRKESDTTVHTALIWLGLSCGTWDLVSWPGIEPRPPALGAQSLSHWSLRITLLMRELRISEVQGHLKSSRGLKPSLDDPLGLPWWLHQVDHQGSPYF